MRDALKLHEYRISLSCMMILLALSNRGMTFEEIKRELQKMSHTIKEKGGKFWFCFGESHEPDGAPNLMRAVDRWFELRYLEGNDDNISLTHNGKVFLSNNLLSIKTVVDKIVPGYGEDFILKFLGPV